LIIEDPVYANYPLASCNGLTVIDSENLEEVSLLEGLEFLVDSVEGISEFFISREQSPCQVDNCFSRSPRMESMRLLWDLARTKL
jgi:hypothetical protein